MSTPFPGMEPYLEGHLSINYREDPPPPPLGEEEREWMKQLLDQ